MSILRDVALIESSTGQVFDIDARTIGSFSLADYETLALTTNGNGASLIGIEDSQGIYTATTVEGALEEVKQLADSLALGMGDFWAAAKVSTRDTGNVTLSGLQTIEGYTLLAGDRVFVGSQTDATENGIYLAAAGAWTRATDADASNEFTINKTVFIETGTTCAGCTFAYVGPTSPNLGVDDIDFEKKSTTAIPDGSITSIKLANLSVTNAKIAADAVTSDKIADDAVGTEHIQSGAVDTDELAADAVTTAKILDGAVTDAKITGMASSKLTGIITDTTFQEVETNVDDLITLTGVAENSTDLGTFTGSIITDNSTIKVALQELETEVESGASATDVADLITLSGMPANSTDLGTFTGVTIPDNSTNKAAMQALETQVEAIDTAQLVDDAVTTAKILDGAVTDAKITSMSSSKLTGIVTDTTFQELDANVDDLVTLSGVPENSTDLGTFTGSIITDNSTIKVALQELETQVESQSFTPEDQWAVVQHRYTGGSPATIQNGDTLDGYTVSTGQRFLSYSGGPNNDNGIWVVGASSSTRATDASATSDFFIGKLVGVENGENWGGSLFSYSGPDAPTVGTSALDFNIVSSINTVPQSSVFENSLNSLVVTTNKIGNQAVTLQKLATASVDENKIVIDSVNRWFYADYDATSSGQVQLSQVIPAGSRVINVMKVMVRTDVAADGSPTISFGDSVGGTTSICDTSVFDLSSTDNQPQVLETFVSLDTSSSKTLRLNIVTGGATTGSGKVAVLVGWGGN